MPKVPEKKARPAKTPGWKAKLGTWLLRALALWGLATFLMVLLLRWVDPPTSAFMLSRRLDAWLANESRFSLQYKWVPLSAISPNLGLALMAGEDQKFPTHFGFDVEAIEDAVEDRLEGRKAGGASTLTQQVAKNLFLWSGHSWVRKGIEVYFTLLLEVLLPKARILELHLNLAEYGDGVYGVEAAAQRNFHKSAARVTPHEAASMVAVLPSPRKRRILAPSESVQKRIGWIEVQAERLGPEALELVNRK